MVLRPKNSTKKSKLRSTGSSRYEKEIEGSESKLFSFFFVVVVGSEKKKWIALISYWVPISTECQKKGEQACAVAANSG